jgi:hypothetical protein
MKQLYLDMDGVLADFDKQRDKYFPHFKGRGQDETTAEENEHFWKTVDEKFPNWFGDLEPMPDFKELWSYCNPLKPIILTALPRTNTFEVIRQKQYWIREHCGTWVPIIACLRRHKADYANSDAVLVDDAVVNITKFNKAGGTGILHFNARDTIAALKSVL